MTTSPCLGGGGQPGWPANATSSVCISPEALPEASYILQDPPRMLPVPALLHFAAGPLILQAPPPDFAGRSSLMSTTKEHNEHNEHKESKNI